MTDSVCGYPGDRDEALVAYLYDEGGDLAARAVFEAHLATCVRCADDLAALRGVRTQLSRWSPPDPQFAWSTARSGATAVSANAESRLANRAAWWREIPAWAQVAAALLFLGAAAGVANLDVHYDAAGLSVRTGWMAPAVAARPAAAGSVADGLSTAKGPDSSTPPWRSDLAALERQLKTELRVAPTAAMAAGAVAQAPRPGSDADLLRRVRALIDESERRQQRELALRVAEVIRDVNAQRQADMIKVDRVLGTVRNDLGIQVLKNRAQMQQMDYFIRTSQR
jgi:hypothetical protein